MTSNRTLTIAIRYLRFALGIGFLSAVADRFGFWGQNGAPLVAWGDWSHFCACTAQLNWFLPKALISATAWTATLAEAILGLALVLGCFLRPAALARAILLNLFAITMVRGHWHKGPAQLFGVFRFRGRRSDATGSNFTANASRWCNKSCERLNRPALYDESGGVMKSLEFIKKNVSRRMSPLESKSLQDAACRRTGLRGFGDHTAPV